MVGPSEPDPFNRVVRRARRQGWLVGGYVGILLSGLIIVATLLWPPTPHEYQLYFVTIAAVLVVTLSLPLAFAYNTRVDTRRLRSLAPLIEDADSSMGWGLSSVLRSGLLLAQPSGLLLCVLFVNASGQALHPKVRQGLRWMRWRGTRRVGLVDKRRGPPELRSQLEDLRTRIGAGKFSMCQVRQRSTLTPDPAEPQWIVGAGFAPGSSFLGFPVKVDRILPELPAIETFLRNVLRSVAGTLQAVPNP